MLLYYGKAKKRPMVKKGRQPWLPQQVQVSLRELRELMGAAEEGLVALSVAVGLAGDRVRCGLGSRQLGQVP